MTKDRQLILDGLHTICEDICTEESSIVPDEDGWCELVWHSCDHDGDAAWEQSRMIAILDSHGIEHENSSVPPEWWGYSEYTPTPGWVMRMRVKLDRDGLSNELRLAMRLVEETNLRRKWSRVAYSLHRELKSYLDAVHDFRDHDCQSTLCHFVRAAYEANSDLYDRDPSEFPSAGRGGVTDIIKSIFPMARIDKLADFGKSPFLHKPPDTK